MSDRTLHRLGIIGWFLLVIGVVAFFIGTDEVNGGGMLAGLALCLVGGVLASLRYTLSGRGEGDDASGPPPPE